MTGIEPIQTRLMRPALFQLSYTAEVTKMGFEPMTLGLGNRCSIH